jgi:hypothetical protein
MAFGKLGAGFSHLGAVLGSAKGGNNKPIRADNTTKTADTTALTADYSK